MKLCEKSVCEKNNVFSAFFGKYAFTALFGFIFGSVLYSQMTINQLTNTFDGLWQQNYYLSGSTELSSGRWLLILVDKLLMGLHADPVSSILAISLFVLGFLSVLDLFGIKSRLHSCICLALFVSSTAISNTLSYRFTSFGYGLAFLFAVLGIYSIVKIRKNVVSVLVAGVFLGMAVSLYQAYLSVFCTVSVFYLILTSTKENSEKSVFRALLRILLSAGAGVVFYVLSLSIFLKLYGTHLSSYNGIGETSLSGILSALPHNIINIYRYFGAYFFAGKLKITALPHFALHLVLFLLVAILIVVIAVKVWKQNKWLFALVLPLCAIIPVCANAYMLISADKLELQMATGLALTLPLIFVLAFSLFENKAIIKSICVVFSVLLLYGSCMQVMIDQEAMYEGRAACETLATQIIDDLKDENLLSENYRYYFVGTPVQSRFFSASDAFYSANAYAQLGNFWTSGNCCQISYGSLINKYMGFSLPVLYTSYEEISETANISDMPSFPDNGYIYLTNDNTVIIKVSDHKEYTGFSKYVFN